jgi:cysteinyl-tRNA synthetase
MKIYNTLSAEKEEFSPIDDIVRMYVCGVTPQSNAHLGHAMSYINFDVIRRYLTFCGYKIKFVQNVTDIEDKIIDKANRLGISTTELVERNVRSFQQDMASLNVKEADVCPWATMEIPKILEVVTALVEKGYAYVAGGSVYFRVRKVDDYGKLSHHDLEQLMTGTRIEPGADKEHQMDFVLWKAAKPGEPSWDSPWGKGRPGWHIECSAMSLKYLGEQIDIHGGGQDLIFPHHENEIAQTESFSEQKPFVKYWLHNGLLRLGEEKMSKSTGNLITIKEALARYSADAIRVFVLSSHYRKPLTYLEEALESAEQGAERLRQVVRKKVTQGSKVKFKSDIFRDRFVNAMDDDFNAPQALASLFDMAREINKAHDNGQDTSESKVVFEELANVLGLTLKKVAFKLDTEEIEIVASEIATALGLKNFPSAPPENLVNMLLKLRQSKRDEKKWFEADLIRDRLTVIGVDIQDTPEGYNWEYKPS